MCGMSGYNNSSPNLKLYFLSLITTCAAHLQIFQCNQSFVFHFFKKCRCQACNFLKLVGQMCHVAVMQFIGNFCKGELVINKQLFGTFDFMCNDEMFNGCAFYF